MNSNPLVSVIVVTYNSEKTVIETLDSVSAQTYDNLELIITDDGSKDNTVTNIEKWLKTHQDRFINTELLTVEQNTGTVKNVNRGIQAANATWLKPIAGDDILLPNCVFDNIRYIEERSDAKVVFSMVKEFGSAVDANYVSPFNYKTFTLCDSDFLYLMLCSNFIPAPALFISKDIFNKYGLYDETIPLVEDWPYWIKLLINKVHFDFLDKVTVKYRVENSSVSMSRTKGAFYKSICLSSQYSLKVQRKISLVLWLYNYMQYLSYRYHYLLPIVWRLRYLSPAYYRIQRIKKTIDSNG